MIQNVNYKLVSGTVKPRPSTATSLPSLIATFQNEWDALMLESFSLKKELENVFFEDSFKIYLISFLKFRLKKSCLMHSINMTLLVV